MTTARSKTVTPKTIPKLAAAPTPADLRGVGVDVESIQSGTVLLGTRAPPRRYRPRPCAPRRSAAARDMNGRWPLLVLDDDTVTGAQVGRPDRARRPHRVRAADDLQIHAEWLTEGSGQ